MTTEERLDKLEQELARANRRNRWLMTVVGLAIVGLALAGTWTPTTGVVQAEAAGTTPKVIRANEFIVEDENGRTRAKLGMTDAPRLALFDENGKERATLRLERNVPSVLLFDENSKNRVQLCTDEDGAGVFLRDENGETRAAMGAHVTTMPDGTKTRHPESSLWLFGPDGKWRWSAP